MRDLLQWAAAIGAAALFLWAIGAFDAAPACHTDSECSRLGGDGGPGGFWKGAK